MAISPLDNRTLMKQVDQANYLSHILEIPEQLIAGYELVADYPIPAMYAQAKQVLILATGEMLPVAQAMQALCRESARIPVIISEDYSIPRWVGSETVVIGFDYNGMAEEVLVAFREAALRRARLLAISIDGELAKEARRHRALHIPLEYGAPARVAFAYLCGVMAHIWRKLDLADIRETVITESAVLVKSLLQNIGPDVPHYQNGAKQLAEKIFQMPTVIIGSGPLASLASKWQVSFAMTGKLHVSSTTLNMFNGTMVNGVRPRVRGQGQLLVMLQSKYDVQRNKLQQTLTYHVAQAQKIAFEQIFMHPSGSLLGELVLCATFGDIVAYYLACLQNVDPGITEASDYIKEHLAQEPLA